jgi:hypothetical protein
MRVSVFQSFFVIIDNFYKLYSMKIINIIINKNENTNILEVFWTNESLALETGPDPAPDFASTGSFPQKIEKKKSGIPQMTFCRSLLSSFERARKIES